MPNSGSTIVPVMLALAGVGFSLPAIATQPLRQRIDTIFQFKGGTNYLHSILQIAKKCPIKRYRHPH
ncbi:hypothetical protein [Chamaesiphon sp.]|uniref:hypothetical protein n=1 Tax=Chamaesiphon sp. TaxID=2814140 RepID=UPI0035932951